MEMKFPAPKVAAVYVTIAYRCIDYANDYYLNMKQGSQGCGPSLQSST
jgi:hypothetical protein